MARKRYRDFAAFKSILVNEVWYWTKQQRKTHAQYLELLNREVFGHPDIKRLTREDRAYLRGVNDTLYAQVVRAMDWRFPVDGNLYTWDQWREAYPTGNCAELKGNHYWPGTDKPWGHVDDAQ